MELFPHQFALVGNQLSLELALRSMDFVIIAGSLPWLPKGWPDNNQSANCLSKP